MNIEVILSPALLHLSDIKDCNVVVIDILRATSTICTALHHGASLIRPLKTPEEALKFKESGYLTAAERNGLKLEGFDMGNSPFECMKPEIKGRNIALTTTNGTKCIEAVKTGGPAAVFAGSFLNLNAQAELLIQEQKDIVMLCAGWKDKFNLEDTLFAGALASRIVAKTETNELCDASLMSIDLYNSAGSNLSDYLKKSSHYKRLSYLSHNEDMVYCLQDSIFETIAHLVGNEMKKK